MFCLPDTRVNAHHHISSVTGPGVGSSRVLIPTEGIRGDSRGIKRSITKWGRILGLGTDSLGIKKKKVCH